MARKTSAPCIQVPSLKLPPRVSIPSVSISLDSALFAQLKQKQNERLQIPRLPCFLHANGMQCLRPSP